MALYYILFGTCIVDSGMCFLMLVISDTNFFLFGVVWKASSIISVGYEIMVLHGDCWMPSEKYAKRNCTINTVQHQILNMIK